MRLSLLNKRAINISRLNRQQARASSTKRSAAEDIDLAEIALVHRLNLLAHLTWRTFGSLVWRQGSANNRCVAEVDTRAR